MIGLRKRWILWFVAFCPLAVLGLLRWGGVLLVSSDPLPSHADVAIVLQGSVLGEIARVGGAVQLVREGIAGQMLVSVPAQSYWGQSVPSAARAYIDRNYGPEIADRLVFCETGPDVDSTQQEAQTLRKCIRDSGWHTVIVVTSDYHTRRAGRIWRTVLKNSHPAVQLWIHGVPDPEFQAHGWWRKRLWAKTWFYEFTKLVTESL